MLSPRVQNLVKRCRRTQEAMAAYAPLIGERRGDDGAPTDSLRWFRDDVGSAADAAVEADLAHSRAVQAHQEWAERRDALCTALYREVVDLRTTSRDLYAKGLVKRSLALSGKTPRRPSDLIEWARVIFVLWRDGDGVFPDPLGEAAFAMGIARARKLTDELEAAYDAAGRANLTRLVARQKRREAIERCEWVTQEDSRIVEGWLSRSGHRDLVVKIRGKRPRGRPRKGDPPRSKPKPKPAPVAAVSQGRTLLLWVGRVARKAGRLFRRRDPEERRDLRRAA